MSRKSLQREIDEEVSAYQKRIRELNTRRNTYADISMLPQDLLADIFLLVQANSQLKNWHQITHVSQQWRGTAISTPILWTEPPTRHHDYTILMLERSKTANLNIFLGSQISTATLSSILSQIGRVQTLKISLTTRALIDVCGRLIASGHMLSERLEALDIEHSSQWHGTTVDWTFLSALIRQSSSLRSIRLSLVTFDWQMLAPSNLASLHLIQIGLIEKISGKTLLDTLGKMPCLQHLAFDLDDLLLPQDPPYTREADKIALLHLQSLDATDYKRPHIPYLLSHLLLPKLNSLKIATFRVRDGQGYSSDSLAAITATIANGDFRVSGGLLVERNHLRISAFGEVFVDIRLPRATNDYEIRCTQQLLRQIAPCFRGLVQVTLVIPLNSDELVQIFGNMHRLRAVTMYGYGTLISALTGALAHCSDHANSPQGARAFSSLDTIGWNDVYWGEVDSGVVTNFCNVLLQRSNHAAAIKTVYCPDNLQRLHQEKQVLLIGSH
ncbi:hypothetical protein D9619_010092 [Psilocybe cf. subviscida]|uniref:F-box domain-containing protein n=1 Tax=Psilocybe cf. subviscida TaxID=2480587 RepID=A0A8H5BKY5_9AGAR|nr:hypothetical protein D9619_010092 [Psilocybe cf. subviscida]